MLVDQKLPVLGRRFAWVLKGEPYGPDKIFDEDLAHYAEAAVIPTRGALVPEWLLVVPRLPCLSVAELDTPRRLRLRAIGDEVLARVSDRAGGAIMFEHGASRLGTSAGCGVDQAHLHVVGGPPELFDLIVRQVDEAVWTAVDHADPWSAMPTQSDYLVVRDWKRAVRAIVTVPTSQRLRRAIAAILGRGNEWDYRSHPNASNACRTKEVFRSAFADVVA